MTGLERGEGVFVVVNPRAGRTRNRPDPVPVLHERLPDAIVHVLAEHEDVGPLLRTHAGVDRLVALGTSGGDGTTAAGAAAALDAHVPLLVLPGGTDNHFAHLLGIDSVEAAIDAAVAGERRPVDLVAVQEGGRRTGVALNTLNVGLYPGFVRWRERLEPVLGRHLAMLAAAARSAVRAAPLEVTIDGRQERIWTLFVGAGGYSPAAGAPLRRAVAASGVLDVRLLRAGPIRRAAGVAALVRHGSRGTELGPRTRRLQPVRVRSFEVRGRRGPDVAHDGEAVRGTGQAYAVTVECIPDAIQVYAPAGMR